MRLGKPINTHTVGMDRMFNYYVSFQCSAPRMATNWFNPTANGMMFTANGPWLVIKKIAKHCGGDV